MHPCEHAIAYNCMNVTMTRAYVQQCMHVRNACHVRTCAWIYVNMCVMYVCVRACVHAIMRICVYDDMRALLHACMRAMHACNCARMCV